MLKCAARPVVARRADVKVCVRHERVFLLGVVRTENGRVVNKFERAVVSLDYHGELLAGRESVRREAVPVGPFDQSRFDRPLERFVCPVGDFFIVGEWKGQPGENISCLSYEKDETVLVVTKCAWYDTWKEYGLLDYGPYYCRYIDKAICEGYASDFSLDVSETIDGGDARCVFKWSAPADKDLVTGTKKEHILPFDFHCKEMLESVKNVLDKELCETVLKKTQRDFEEEFGDSDLF